MLTSWERVIRELDHEEPDRVPWGGEQISHPTADVVLGRPALTGMGANRRIVQLDSEGKRSAVRARIMMDTFDLARRLSMDLVLVHPLPSRKTSKPRILSQHEWSYTAGRRIRTVEGNLLSLEIEEATGRRIRHTMQDLERLVDNLKSDRTELDDAATQAFDEIAPLIRKIGHGLKAATLFPTWNCFLTHPDWLPTFLKAFHTRTDLIMGFEKAQARRAKAYGRAALDAGCDIVGIGGDLAYKDGPMISPDKYRRFILPFMKQESRAMHRRGGYVMIASDGDLMPISQDYFIGSEVDAAREIEPGAMDRLKVKEGFGDRVCLNGNVDCGRTLSLLSPEEVTRETCECIAHWAPGGGHIISSSNTISPGVKPENFFAMRKAILRYGHYPSDRRTGSRCRETHLRHPSSS